MRFIELDRDDMFDSHDVVHVVIDNEVFEVVFTLHELPPPAEAVAEVSWPRRPFCYSHKTYAVPVRLDD